MSTESPPASRDPSIRRRRRTLNFAALLALVIVAAVAGRPLLTGVDKPKQQAKVLTPVIVERIQMKPVGNGRARGLAEVLRRGDAESLRVLVARLKPSQRRQVYRLVLTGGEDDEKVLGNEVVDRQRIFVGEAKLALATLNQYRRIELRLVTHSEPPSQRTVLRGTIPR